MIRNIRVIKVLAEDDLESLLKCYLIAVEGVVLPEHCESPGDLRLLWLNNCIIKGFLGCHGFESKLTFIRELFAPLDSLGQAQALFDKPLLSNEPCCPSALQTRLTLWDTSVWSNPPKYGFGVPGSPIQTLVGLLRTAMILSIRRGPDIILTRKLGGTFIVGRELMPLIGGDEQLQVGSHIFVPNASLVVTPSKVNHFVINQDDIDFLSLPIANIEVLVAKRSAYLLNPKLNPFVTSKSAHPVIKQNGVTTFSDSLFFSKITEKIKGASKKGHRVLVDGQLIQDCESVEFSQDPDSQIWSIKCSETNNVPIRLYFELLIEPDHVFVGSDSFNNGLLTLIFQFTKIYPNGKQVPETTASLLRRTNALAEFGIIWNEGFECICASLGRPKFLKVTNTSLPFSPNDAFLAGDEAVLTSLEEYLSSDPSMRSIIGPLRNTLAGYRNPEKNEATLNSKLWTPLLDALLLPDETCHQSRLFSTTDYSMNQIKGFDRKLRVDYVVRVDEIPLAVVEYAAAHGERPIMKDFTKSAVTAASLLLEFISKTPDRQEVLRSIHMSLLYISSTEIEYAILRPIFDTSLGLKGFSLTTNPHWIFDIQSPREDHKPFDEPAPLDNISFTIRSSEKLPTTMSNHVAIPDVPLVDRSIACPERLDLNQIDYEALAFLRGLGLHLNKQASTLMLNLDAQPPPSGLTRPILVYSTELQKSVYAQAITTYQTPGVKGRQDDPAESVSPSERIGKKLVVKVKGLLNGLLYGYSKWKRRGNVHVFKIKSFEGVKHTFELRPLVEYEWFLLKSFAEKGVLPKYALLKRFDKKNLILVGGEHLIPLVKYIWHGGFGSLWQMHLPERVGAMLVDIIVAIDALWKHGWVHNDVSPQTLVYSTTIHSWTFRTFQTVQLIAGTGTKSNCSPQIDLICLASVAEWIVKELAKNRLASMNGLGQNYQAKLDELLDFCIFLRSSPSLPLALERVHAFYKQYRRCSKQDVKFQKTRFRRLTAAIKSYRSTDVSCETAQPAPVKVSPMKRPASNDESENMPNFNDIIN